MSLSQSVLKAVAGPAGGSSDYDFSNALPSQRAQDVQVPIRKVPAGAVFGPEGSFVTLQKFEGGLPKALKQCYESLGYGLVDSQGRYLLPPNTTCPIDKRWLVEQDIAAVDLMLQAQRLMAAYRVILAADYFFWLRGLQFEIASRVTRVGNAQLKEADRFSVTEVDRAALDSVRKSYKPVRLGDVWKLYAPEDGYDKKLFQMIFSPKNFPGLTVNGMMQSSKTRQTAGDPIDPNYVIERATGQPAVRVPAAPIDLVVYEVIRESERGYMYLPRKPELVPVMYRYRPAAIRLVASPVKQLTLADARAAAKDAAEKNRSQIKERDSAQVPHAEKASASALQAGRLSIADVLEAAKTLMSSLKQISGVGAGTNEFTEAGIKDIFKAIMHPADENDAKKALRSYLIGLGDDVTQDGVIKDNAGKDAAAGVVGVDAAIDAQRYQQLEQACTTSAADLKTVEIDGANASQLVLMKAVAAFARNLVISTQTCAQVAELSTDAIGRMGTAGGAATFGRGCVYVPRLQNWVKNVFTNERALAYYRSGAMDPLASWYKKYTNARTERSMANARLIDEYLGRGTLKPEIGASATMGALGMFGSM